MSWRKKKGVFPYFEKSVYKDLGVRVRNATTTTIAPTGTLSIIAGCSSGIEPLFAISYIRNVMDNDELIEVNPIFREVSTSEGFYSDDLMRRIAKKGSISGFPEIPMQVQNVFVTATISLRNGRPSRRMPVTVRGHQPAHFHRPEV